MKQRYIEIQQVLVTQVVHDTMPCAQAWCVRSPNRGEAVKVLWAFDVAAIVSQ